MFLDIAPPNCLINFSESIRLTAKHTITQANDLLHELSPAFSLNYRGADPPQSLLLQFSLAAWPPFAEGRGP